MYVKCAYFCKVKQFVVPNSFTYLYSMPRNFVWGRTSWGSDKTHAEDGYEIKLKTASWSEDLSFLFCAARLAPVEFCCLLRWGNAAPFFLFVAVRNTTEESRCDCRFTSPCKKGGRMGFAVCVHFIFPPVISVRFLPKTQVCARSLHTFVPC